MPGFGKKHNKRGLGNNAIDSRSTFVHYFTGGLYSKFQVGNINKNSKNLIRACVYLLTFGFLATGLMGLIRELQGML